MRFILLSCLLISNIFCNVDIQQTFNAANSQYNETNYLKAIELYESILDDGFESVALYYNLGNTYFRQNYIGQSVWAYNKAIKLNSRDKDLIHNLNVANSRVKDRIMLPQEYFFINIYNGIKNLMNLNEWILISSISFLLSTILFFLMRVFQLGYSLIPKILNIFLILTFFQHLILLDFFLNNDQVDMGVLIENQVAVRSGPFSLDDNIVVKLNEGILTQVGQSQNDWVEITLLDGTRGWVYSDNIREL
mgnify:FL=1